MWMQKSFEGASISSAGNLHNRNRFSQSGGSGMYDNYSGGSSSHASGNGDWKNKILESGQWLGGKVIEYGGKLARGASHDTIPDHGAPYMPRNDGRANWMADIRGSSSSSSSSYANNSGGYNSSGFAGSTTYQNDFATERPKAYSDQYSGSSSSHYNNNSSSSLSSHAYASSSSARPSQQQQQHSRYRDDNDHKERRRAKKKSDASSSKHARKSSKKYVSDSDASSHRSSGSSSDASDSDRAVKRRSKSSKTRKHSKSSSKKHAFYSEDDDDNDDDSASSASDRDVRAKTKSKAKDRKKSAASPPVADANYTYSFDPSKLPPPPATDDRKRAAKSSKPRGRRQSVESSDASDKENHKAPTTKRSGKAAAKAAKATTATTVDLLGVGFDAEPMANAPGASSNVQPSVFDSLPALGDPLQDLAGLSFPAHPFEQPQPRSVFAPHNDATRTEQPATQQQFATTLLPENSIVDLESLASEKKKTASDGAAATEKRTLNDLQKARASSEQPTPVMPMAMHATGAPMHGALVPAGGMMMQPMMHAPAMAPNATMQQQQMMMMNPQAQWMQQQQQQQFAMANGMMHPSGAYTAAPASGASAFAFQQ